MSRLLYLVLALSTISQLSPALAQGSEGRGSFGDLVEQRSDEYEEHDGLRDLFQNPVRYLVSRCLCFGLILIIVAGVTALTDRNFPGSNVKTFVPESERSWQTAQDEESDEREELFGEQPVSIRTRQSLAQDYLASATTTSLALSAEMLETRFKEINPDTMIPGQTMKVVAQVTNTPSENFASNSKFEPAFEGHIGVYLFAIDLIESRKADTMWDAFYLAGGETLDLNVASNFAMRVDVPLTVQKPTVPANQRVQKYETLDLLVGLALDKETKEPVLDEFGSRIVEVKSYSVRPAETHAPVTRRRPPIGSGDIVGNKEAD